MKDIFTVPGSPSGGLSERDEGAGGRGGSSAQKGGYIYQTSWSGGVKYPPGVTSAVSVSVSGSKAKMVRFTTIEVRMEGAGLLILRTV